MIQTIFLFEVSILPAYSSGSLHPPSVPPLHADCKYGDLPEDTRHTIYTDKMEFHVLELPKLPEKLIDGSSDILLWAKFINAERKEEFDMLAEKNPYIGSAYQHLQLISQDKQKRLEYEARAKAVRDYNQGMLEAREQGIKQGADQLGKLIAALIASGRVDDAQKGSYG